jgi:hypothetical protein
MTYGSLVTQLLRDFEDTDAVNKQLEKMYFSFLPLTYRQGLQNRTSFDR